MTGILFGIKQITGMDCSHAFVALETLEVGQHQGLPVGLRQYLIGSVNSPLPAAPRAGERR